jgi:vacuolar protein sorting-associated protein 54
LVGEIGARSESFFEASARLHELDAIVSETCGAIRRTRRSLLEASTYATCAHESVTSLHRKRANLRTLTHVFEALSSVRECREDLDVLVAAEDCGGALEVCEEIRRKVSDPTLAGLACLKDVAAHVDGVENQVVSALVLEFTRAARVQPGSVGHPGDETGEFGTDGLSSEPNSRRRVSPGDGWGPATTRAALAEVRAAARDAGMENVLSASEEDEEDDVSPSDQDVVGLGPSEESSADVFDAALPPLRALIRGGAHRTGRIGDAMRAWGRDAASDARACIRRACLASLRVADSTVLGVQSVDMDGSNYSANSVSTEKATYKAMETLPAEVFAAVIRAATHALAGHFARAEIVRSAAQYALGTVAKDGGENTSRGIVADDVRTQLCASLPPGERASASAAASDAVLALADASQGAMAKILASRASTNARLTLREFSKICDAAESFLARAESLSGGRRCLSLRGALNTQCKDFMSVRHAAHAAKLGSVLESETWTAVAPVPGEYQRILDAGFEPCVAVNSAERGAEGGADTAVHDDDDTAVRDALVLPGGERVVPVGASLALLKMCADHLAVARRVPSLGPVAVYKIAELLRVFNSRTSQLVLGAGSMRTAGLRSITAKHLALAQQSVRLFLEVTPAVSAALSPTLPDTRRTQLLSEFTSTVRDLEKHKTELQTKMVSIARDRLVYHSARLPTIWCSHIFTARKASLEEGAADLAEASSEFATALGKEVGTLRRVIAGTLSNEDATCVLNEVLRVFDEGLTAALAGSKESTANEWRAKMGSPTKPKPAVPMDDAEGGAEEGADTAVVHDDDGEETEETTVKSAAPSENEVNGLIGRDGGALLGTLGTLVNGGTGGDGACGAPTLAKYLLEYRS